MSMEGKSPGSKETATKRLKFAPKVPPRRTRKPVEVKREDQTAIDPELLKRMKVGFGRGGPKVGNESEQVQVAFGCGDSPACARPFSFPGHPGSSSNTNAKQVRSAMGSEASQTPEKPPSFPGHSSGTGSESGNNGGGNRKARKAMKEYVEPWDYSCYYPTSLPLREPYTGDPEVLDEQEFGENAVDLDEMLINPTKELGLMDATGGNMILFQLPSTLPSVKQYVSSKGKDKIGEFKSRSKEQSTSSNACSLEDLKAGLMGKMYVYKSGKVKIKLGDNLFDVEPGTHGNFPQDVAAINVKEQHLCKLGEIHKRAIVTPDIDALLDDKFNEV